MIVEPNELDVPSKQSTRFRDVVMGDTGAERAYDPAWRVVWGRRAAITDEDAAEKRSCYSPATPLVPEPFVLDSFVRRSYRLLHPGRFRDAPASSPVCTLSRKGGTECEYGLPRQQ